MSACRSCGAPVVWAETAGARLWLTIDGGELPWSIDVEQVG